MTTKSIFSLSSLKDKNRLKDTIPCRIEFIKELLKGKKLNPMVDFDNTNTDAFLPHGKDENASGESYDTRVVLKKQYYKFANIISQIGGRLQYIKSGTTGHTFKGRVDDEKDPFEYAVKVVAYPKKVRYGNINDIRRPENAELMMIKLLSYFIAKKQTPHIVLPIGTFNTDIETFVNLINEEIVDDDNDKYNEFVERYEKKDYHNNVSVLISEWANRGDFLDFARKYHKEFTPIHWKTFFFQILSVIAVIQSKYPTFRHNDMKANNILIHKITKQKDSFDYRVVGYNYRVPNIGYQIKLWDFDFACIPGIVDNRKVESDWTKAINVTPIQNRYYDVHYFFNTLIKKGFCPEVMTSEKVPKEVKEFINRIVPSKYQKTDTKFIHKKGRLLVNDEYTTPDDILKYDPYFEEFRNFDSKKIIKNDEKKQSNTNKPQQELKKQSKPIVKSFTKRQSNKSKEKKQIKSKSKKKMSSLSKLLQIGSDSSSDSINDDKINITDLLKGKKNINKSKNNVKSKKHRTISEEIRELDPDLILKASSNVN
jgi:hypothetical protein